MTIRRVTSAKGWGEVRITEKYIMILSQIQACGALFGRCTLNFSLLSKLFRCEKRAFPFLNGFGTSLQAFIHFSVLLSLQVEFGAGDILGPLIGLKVFRNVTPRW